MYIYYIYARVNPLLALIYSCMRDGIRFATREVMSLAIIMWYALTRVPRPMPACVLTPRPLPCSVCRGNVPYCTSCAIFPLSASRKSATTGTVRHVSSTKHRLSGRRSTDCRRVNHLRPTGSRTPDMVDSTARFPYTVTPPGHRREPRAVWPWP